MLITITKPFMRIYVADSFYESWRYVPILLASAAFASVAYYYGSLYGVLKKSGRNMATTLLAAVVNIVVNYVGIKFVGIYGAAIGTLVAYIVMAFVRMVDVGRFINIQINWTRFLAVCMLTVIQAVFVTLDLGGYIVSTVALIAFIIINRDLVVVTVQRLKKMIHR